jgi:hypothetical protein
MLPTTGELGCWIAPQTLRMTRTAVALGVTIAAMAAVLAGTPAPGQNAALDEIKVKILEARAAQQNFAEGLKHCSELDGSHFYFQSRNRVLNLEDYHRSLNSLALQGAFNPETRRPWSQDDAAARWEEARKQALDDKEKCALVASLPELQKRLEALQSAGTAESSR